MNTLALDQSGAKFSLACRKDAPVYYFSIESAHPTSPGMEEEARFSIRVANQDPIWFQTAWHGGGIEVREQAHETAFSIVMSRLSRAGRMWNSPLGRSNCPFLWTAFWMQEPPCASIAEMRWPRTECRFPPSRGVDAVRGQASSRAAPPQLARQIASPAPAAGSECPRA